MPMPLRSYKGDRFDSWPGFPSKEPAERPTRRDTIEQLQQKQLRLLEALYETRISTTNIWRSQGWFIPYPPRRTVQQEAQTAMQIYQLDGPSRTAHWVEPGETLRENEIAEDADALQDTNGRLHSTLVEEIHNLMTEPIQVGRSSYLGRSGRPFGPLTPASTPSRKSGSGLRRQYAEFEGLGGYPCPEDPLPRPDFKKSLSSPESSSGSRTYTSRGSYRSTPYRKRPTRTLSSTAILGTGSPESPTKRRAGTPFDDEVLVHYDTEESATERDAEVGEPSAASPAVKESKPKSREDAAEDKDEN